MSAPTRALAARIVALAGICLLLTSAAAAAVDGHITGWITEPGVDPPSYAVTEPIDSNVNVDTVLLLCTERGRDRFLELDLYPSTEGPLLPDGADPQALKDAPAVQISIDGALFPAQLLFADDYVLVANSPPHTPPSLSAPLLDAMERGETMVVRFDLLTEAPGRAAAFDGQIVVDLSAGRSAIAAVRRCASQRMLHQASTKGRRH